jgi:hypothetical protein
MTPWSFMFNIYLFHSQVESHPNSQTMMNVARNLRLERDKEKKLAEQRQEQATLVSSVETLI